MAEGMFSFAIWLAEKKELILARDPFGAGPLRGRLEEDGVLVLWSVGPDGEDDGGATELPHDDVAVAVQPAG